jgi:hypothetical protein
MLILKQSDCRFLLQFKKNQNFTKRGIKVSNSQKSFHYKVIKFSNLNSSMFSFNQIRFISVNQVIWEVAGEFLSKLVHLNCLALHQIHFTILTLMFRRIFSKFKIWTEWQKRHVIKRNINRSFSFKNSGIFYMTPLFDHEPGEGEYFSLCPDQDYCTGPWSY